MTDDVSTLGLDARELRTRQLEQLALSWRSCTDCALSRSRQHVVFHRGDACARLAIVAEAPGHDEDLHGKPFVGANGKLIDALLAEAKVSFTDVCFLNMVGCRPPQDRVPKHDELRACAPRTLAMLRAIDPVCVLMLGKTAAQLARVTSIGPWRGKPVEVELGQQRVCRGVVSYHPSFLLRQGNSAKIRRRMLSDIMVAISIASAMPKRVTV